MLLTQKQQIEMYQRVQQFLAGNAPPASKGYTTQKAVLDDVVAKLTEHTDDQVTGRRLSRAETVRIAALRVSLRKNHLAPISKIARASFRDLPGIQVALKLPSESLATMRLINEAQGIRKAIAQYEPAFVEAGRPEDFLAQLDAAIEALRASLLGKATQIGTHVGARKGLEREIQRGRKAVDLIDTMVQTAFVNQVDVLGRWRAAMRLQLVGQQATTVAAPASAPEPTTAAAKPAA